MKLIKKWLLIIMAALCSLCVLAGCKTPAAPAAPNEGLRLNYDNYRLEIFQSFTLAIEGEYKGTPVWNSDNPTVISVEDGLVSGLAEGSAVISVEVDNTTLTCNVTVMETEDVPMLSFDGVDEISVLMGEVYELNAYVLYKGEKYDDATFTYTIEDTSIATVENGVFTAVKAGATTVYISADWRSYTNSDLLKTSLPVKVNADVLAKIDSQATPLYNVTESLFKYNVSYVNSCQLQATVLKDGAAADESFIVWKSSDESVATVDSEGVVRAVGVGTANITVCYEENGVVCTSEPLAITVEAKPIVDMTRFKPLLIDCFLGNDLIAADDNKITFDFTPYTDGQAVTKITDTATNTAVAYDAQTKAFTSPAIGETVWLIETPLYTLKANVICATKVISTVQELIDMQKYGNLSQKHYPVSYLNNNGVQVDSNYIAQNYEGYFVLVNNVNFTYEDYVNEERCFESAYTSITVNASVFPQVGEIGFSGTFNGLGYSISNIVTGKGGLFGNIAADGLIKNLTINNAKFKKIRWNSSGVIADAVCGTLENVNILVDFEGLSYQNDYSNASAIAYRVHSLTLRNVNVVALNLSAGHNVIANYSTGTANKVINCKISTKDNPLVMVGETAPFNAFTLFPMDTTDSDVTMDDIKWD